MQKAKNFYLLGLTLLIVTVLISCSKFNFSGISTIGMNVTSIGELKAEKQNTTVYIQGQIEKQVPLLQQRRAYQLQDSTGKIWIVTNQTNLQVGQQVVIKGKLRYSDILLAGKNYGDIYVEEL